MGKNYEVLSQEAISYMCGLLRNMASVADGIDDLNLKTDGTFSSVKIDNLIKQVLSDGKDYADQICASLVKLTCQKTTVQPTLDNSEINVIYLYSADGNAPFEQWLKISDTELIDMGSTTISLDNYYDKATADNKFSLKTSVEDIVNVIGTDTLSTTATTLKGAINEVKGIADDKVDKTDIAITLSDTSTDDEVASAKAVYDTIKSEISELKFCNPNLLDNPWFTVNQRGATNLNCGGNGDVYFVDRWNNANCGMTVFNLKDNGVNFSADSNYSSLDQIVEFLPSGEYTLSFEVVECGVDLYSIYVFDPTSQFSKVLSFTGTGIKTLTFTLATDMNAFRTRIYIDPINNNTNGITVRRAKLERGSVSTLENETPPNYEMELLKCKLSKADINDAYSNKSIYISKVADSSGTVTLPDGVTGVISYKVVNGICYVSIQGLADGLTGVQVCTFTGLPKADIYINIGIEYLGNRVGTIYTDDGVTFYVHKTTTNSGYGSFSYPVAES